MRFTKCTKEEATHSGKYFSDRRERTPRYAAEQVEVFYRLDEAGEYEGHDRGLDDGVIVIPQGDGYQDRVRAIA
jgi:hypothetical protein